MYRFNKIKSKNRGMNEFEMNLFLIFRYSILLMVIIKLLIFRLLENKYIRIFGNFFVIYLNFIFIVFWLNYVFCLVFSF